MQTSNEYEIMPFQDPDGVPKNLVKYGDLLQLCVSLSRKL
jgi:hypothetical protein